MCDNQVVLDSTTNLIKNASDWSLVGPRIGQRFRKQALISLQDAERAMLGQTHALIPAQKLLKLLEYLNIVSRFPAKSSQDLTYFMPCVLRNIRGGELGIHSCCSDSDPAPLLLHFDCGFVPPGVFTAMIANLVSQQRRLELVLESVYKNVVHFLVGEDYDKVTLISHPRYFEIVLSRHVGYYTPTESLCSEVLGVIQSTLSNVTQRMSMRHVYKLGFQCPIHPGGELCVLPVDMSPKYMKCLGRSQVVQLEPKHIVWFAES